MAYIFDIDGTLADCSHRLHYISGEHKDWDAFYKECVNDKPIMDVMEILWALQESGSKIIYVTGRPITYMDETMEWLQKYVGNRVVALFMRKDGDHREDYIIKKEIYEEDIKDYMLIDGVFEDRKQCVDMWRSLGLTCYQVADGNY